MARLQGKVALVTGGASVPGLGSATAIRFAQEGARVYLTDRDLAGAEKVADDIRHSGGHAVALHHDVTSEADWDRVMAAIDEAEGRLDVLVNNAGAQKVAPVAEFARADWDLVRTLSLDASFECIKAAVPGMVARGWGRIINIASAHGLIASPFKSAYTAAKHGLVGLTKSVALEVAEAGVTANAICPGYVRTPLVEKQIDDQMKVHGLSREAVIRDIMLASQPTRRFVEAEEIAGLASYLASDAARSITGTTIAIDGGWTAR